MPRFCEPIAHPIEDPIADPIADRLGQSIANTIANTQALLAIAAVCTMASVIGVTPCWSATGGGAPEPPRPGGYPRAWLTWVDDSLNGEVGENRDDFRSSSIIAGCRMRSLLACVEYANLTDKSGIGGRPARVDELTATLGGLLERRSEGWAGELAAGAGWRRSGDLGGERLQNTWHGTLGVPRVSLAYERPSDEGVGYLRAGWLGHRDLPGLAGEAGVHLFAGSLAASRGGWEGSVGAEALWLGQHGEAWVGTMFRYASTYQASQTARAVAHRERGYWIDAGFSQGPWAVEAAVAPRTHAASGSLSALIPFEPVLRRQGGSTVVGEIGATVTSYGLVSLIRWRAHPLDCLPGVGAWLGHHASWVVDYRYGRVPGFAQSDTSLRFRQLSAGIDVAATPVWRDVREPRWLPQPYASVLVGWRQERLQHEGPSSAWAEGSAQRATVSGSLGVRLVTGGHEDETYGVSASIDLWHPLASAASQASGGRIAFQRDGIGASLRFVCAAPW